VDENTLLSVEGLIPTQRQKPHTIIVRRFTVGSLFKIVAIGCLISFFGFSLLAGFFAFFGAHTVRWNSHPVTGASGLMGSICIGAVLGIGFTIIGWIGFVISFWLFSKVGTLKLHYVTDNEATVAAQPRG
jgi:hypothetical protein